MGAGSSLHIAPVGTAVLGAGFFGQLDLAGNVWEWCLDVYAASYVSPCSNGAYLDTGNNRVLRGGGWGNPTSWLPAYYRRSLPPVTADGSYGFRCARVPY